MLLSTVSRPVCLGVKHLSEACDQIFTTVRQLRRVCWCGALTPTKERVCRLQLLLVLASAVLLGSESRGTHDHILLSQIRDSPNLECQVPVFIFPGTGWPSYTSMHWVPFSSPLTTRKSYKKRPEEAKERQLIRGNRQSQSRKEPSQSSKKPAA
jgi:hypothetical protein